MKSNELHIFIHTDHDSDEMRKINHKLNVIIGKIGATAQDAKEIGEITKTLDKSADELQQAVDSNIPK